MKKKEYLLMVFLLGFIFSCKFPNSSNAGRTPSILDKYRHWNVTIEEFRVDPKADKSMVFTVDNKKFALEALALMKLVINTPEFEEAVLKAQDVYAHNWGVVEGGEYNIKQGEEHTKVLDKRRLLEIIRGAKFSAKYVKSAEPNIFRGDMGWLSYAYYGYDKPYSLGGNIYAAYNRYDHPKREVFWFASSAFHEHLHNLGFNHNGPVADVPYTIGTDILQDIARRITGEKAPFDPVLQKKYQKDLKELTDYYFKLYAKELQADTPHPNA